MTLDFRTMAGLVVNAWMTCDISQEQFNEIAIDNKLRSRVAEALQSAYAAGHADLLAENARLREACDFAHTTLEHALHLGYLGEGSTMGMAKDAIEKIDKALNPKEIG